MTEEPEHSDRPRNALTSDRASILLKLGVLGPRRPVDDLVDRLAMADGATWLDRALEQGPTAGMGPPRRVLAERGATVEQLTEIKDRSKRLLKSASTSDQRLAALAGYFLAIAAALRHHHALIGSRGREEIDAALLDLAEFAPEPYSSLLCAATLVDSGG